MVRTSCGTEGFKNIKKSTPIAAQTAGISAAAVISSTASKALLQLLGLMQSVLSVSSFAQKATAKGVTFVRVVVKGLGPGRLVSTRQS